MPKLCFALSLRASVGLQTSVILICPRRKLSVAAWGSAGLKLDDIYLVILDGQGDFFSPPPSRMVQWIWDDTGSYQLDQTPDSKTALSQICVPLTLD